MINYDGRRFRGSETGPDGQYTVAVYHQQDDLMWGEATGGRLRRGTVTGVCASNGVLDFAYSMVFVDGRVVSGRCRSTPSVLDDGRIRLREDWERFGQHADRGVSYLEELA